MPKTVIPDPHPWRCVGQNINKLLVLRGISQKEFCRRMPMSQGHLSAWINGETPASVPKLFRAAEILKVSPAVLVTPSKEIGENCLRFIAGM